MPPSQSPAISVVMPVHNALPHLDMAVRSIVGQSYRDFEFVILDDCSTDGSLQHLRDWVQKDDRIRLIESPKNLGPAASSNAVVEHARCDMIARMDADDISHPDRFARQMELLSARRDVGLVGTLCNVIDGSDRCVRGPDCWRLARRSWFAPFPHGTIMYRRSLFDRVGGYREQCAYWEDQDLFLRMVQETHVLVIPEALYEHRHSGISNRLTSGRERVEVAIDRMYRAIGRLEGGRTYEDLLTADSAMDRRKTDPRVFIALGSLTLWGGGRPKELRPLIERGRLGADVNSLAALVWSIWAKIAPSLLRRFMGLIATVRNRLSPSFADGPVEWKTPSRSSVGAMPGASSVRDDSNEKAMGKAELG